MGETWGTEHRCVECEGVLTSRQRHYADGRCPLCGYKSKFAGTIVVTTERGFRYKPRPWWAIWVPKAREYLDG